MESINDMLIHFMDQFQNYIFIGRGGEKIRLKVWFLPTVAIVFYFS